MKKKSKVKSKKESMKGYKNIDVSEIKAFEVDSIDDLDLSDFEEQILSLDLNDNKKIVSLLAQMFIDGDHDAFMELAALYIDHVGKREMSKRAKIPEKTIYNFKDKKHKTSSENIFRIMKAISEAS